MSTSDAVSRLTQRLAERIHERCWIGSMHCYHAGVFKRCEEDAEALVDVLLDEAVQDFCIAAGRERVLGLMGGIQATRILGRVSDSGYDCETASIVTPEGYWFFPLVDESEGER